MENNKPATHHVLSLRQIAGWRVLGIQDSDSNIRASIPSLQRGLVWEAQQIEMLWDSLMRGFPIGSIVLSEKGEIQKDKVNEISGKAIAGTHHILDGQQRCYAIALGFNDPWGNSVEDQAVLWIDLKPEGQLPKNSVRKYLFRVTTKAHPWGFDHGDQSGTLSVEKIRKFFEKHESDEKPKNRPLPEQSVPYDAGLPVPAFLLFKHFKGGKLDWDAISGNTKLAELIDCFSNKIEEISKNPEYIESGLRLVEQSRIVALQVPAGIEGIENIEQIFQRLNGQGTPIDDEELTYSMIKAYWPDVESYLRDLPHHTTEPRLIGMAVRVALTDEEGKMPAELGVNRIRNIFRPGQQENAKERDEYEAITGYFQNELKESLKWIDANLLYSSDTRAYGLPVYLRSSLAWSSRDVFAWLMWLAKQFDYKPITDDSINKKIIGLALSIHWFGVDKRAAVEYLLIKKTDLLQADVSCANMKDDKDNLVIYRPVGVDVLRKDALPLDAQSSEELLCGWKSFWEGVVNLDKDGKKRLEDDAEARKKNYGYFMERLKANRELLIYVQRAYFDSKFGDFDPSNKLMWKGHNRPWDYDHILPSNKLNATGYKDTAGDFHGVCKVWQQSIANLVAVDFAFNRSAQDVVNASDKYDSNKNALAKQLDGMFGNDIGAYVLELRDTKDFEKSKKFVVAARDRLVRLYEEWYEKLDVGKYK